MIPPATAGGLMPTQHIVVVGRFGKKNMKKLRLQLKPENTKSVYSSKT